MSQLTTTPCEKVLHIICPNLVGGRKAGKEIKKCKGGGKSEDANNKEQGNEERGPVGERKEKTANRDVLKGKGS